MGSGSSYVLHYVSIAEEWSSYTALLVSIGQEGSFFLITVFPFTFLHLPHTCKAFLVHSSSYELWDSYDVYDQFVLIYYSIIILSSIIIIIILLFVHFIVICLSSSFSC